MGSGKEFDSLNEVFFLFCFLVGDGALAWLVSRGCEIRDTSLDTWPSSPEERVGLTLQA